MAAHACAFRARAFATLAPEPPVATVIVLDGHTTIRLTQGGYLLGYFPDVEPMEAHIGLAGMKRLVLR